MRRLRIVHVAGSTDWGGGERYLELLARHPQLDAELRPLAEEALRGALQAAETVHRMQQIARLEEAPTPPGMEERPILDLDRSVTPG